MGRGRVRSFVRSLARFPPKLTGYRLNAVHVLCPKLAELPSEFDFMHYLHSSSYVVLIEHIPLPPLPQSTVAAESWYSSPASHRQDGVVVESSGATAATPKKTSPVGWTPAVKGAPTGKASPAKLAQDNWTVSFGSDGYGGVSKRDGKVREFELNLCQSGLEGIGV